MRRATPLSDPREPATSCTIELDGTTIECDARDTIASALIAAGELMTSRSAKYRRPRGAYCLLGDCGTCLVRVDGEPNVRACLTPVRHGMRVASQNSYGDLDPTALIDRVFPGGIDHHHLVVYPRVANSVMQGVARNLTGFGTLPERPLGPATREDHAPEVLVIGAGRSGRAVAAALIAAGAQVLLLDRRDLPSLAAWNSAPLPAPLRAGVGVFAAYPHEGLWAAAAAAAAASHEGAAAPTLHIIRPRHVVLALGAHVPTLPVPGNDVPGVVSSRGLRHLLARTGRSPAGPVVVIGAGAEAEADAQALGATLVAPDAVQKIVGRRRVKAVETTRGRLTARLVALAPERAPAFELAAQAGAALRWTGAGFVPVCDADGRAELRAEDHPLAGPVHAATTTPPAPAKPPWTLWVTGSLRGGSLRGASDDPTALAAAIVRALGRSTPEAQHG